MRWILSLSGTPLKKLSRAYELIELAEMIGITRSRVNTFMNKFRKLGFIKYNGALRSTTRY
jgi:hypothetical protein